MEGEQLTPKVTRAYLNIFKSSSFWDEAGFLTSLTHKNLTQFRSSCRKLICKKAACKSPAIRYVGRRHRISNPHKSCIVTGPWCRQSLREGLSFRLFPLALNTIRNFVKVLSSLTTGKCVK
ncbi:unnamed protein product [Meloidogyne enterolobii]|uniref:Uncharacterized protein n=1 Tax=Meloidogyne enterolobii TaxID=390850 RepID=A0ACB0YXB9_MELEN